MSDKKMEQAWFELKSVRKRALDRAVWVPLRANKCTDKGRYGFEGYSTEASCVGSVFVPQERRAEGEKLRWSDIGLGCGQEAYAFDDCYKPAEVYQRRDKEDLGIAPVLVQNFSSDHQPVWHLNQDIVIALGLLREGDVWVRPDENFEEIVRLHRTPDGSPNRVEMRAEQLKDYLAARRMAMRVSSYHCNRAVVGSVDHISWEGKEILEHTDTYRFERRVREIHEGGDPIGAKTAIFHAWRTDVDDDDEIPIMGPETDENVDYKSWETTASGPRLFDVSGEYWCDEWVEPSELSPRVRGDHVPSTCEFIVDAQGNKRNADALNDEDVGIWLWFTADVVRALAERRGASYQWYTRDTGGITPCPGYSVHFGVNKLGHINVYACDVCRLPEWQRRFWVAYNISPDGGVCPELMSAQVRGEVAPTKAPEPFLGNSMALIDHFSVERWGMRLFKEHPETDEILQKVSRFRAKDKNGLLSMAKDIARLTADRLDKSVLDSLAPAADKSRGTLKGLEALLATLIDKDDARKALTTLVGIYDLRLADAHLPSSKLQASYSLIPINPDTPYLIQGFDLIGNAVIALQNIAKIIKADAA